MSEPTDEAFCRALELLANVRIRPGHRVAVAGRYRCTGCGAEEEFDVEEIACDCRYDADQADWLLRFCSVKGQTEEVDG